MNKNISEAISLINISVVEVNGKLVNLNEFILGKAISFMMGNVYSHAKSRAGVDVDIDKILYSEDGYHLIYLEDKSIHAIYVQIIKPLTEEDFLIMYSKITAMESEEDLEKKDGIATEFFTWLQDRIELGIYQPYPSIADMKINPKFSSKMKKAGFNVLKDGDTYYISKVKNKKYIQYIKKEGLTDFPASALRK